MLNLIKCLFCQYWWNMQYNGHYQRHWMVENMITRRWFEYKDIIQHYVKHDNTLPFLNGITKKGFSLGLHKWFYTMAKCRKRIIHLFSRTWIIQGNTFTDNRIHKYKRSLWMAFSVGILHMFLSLYMLEDGL